MKNGIKLLSVGALLGTLFVAGCNRDNTPKVTVEVTSADTKMGTVSGGGKINENSEFTIKANPTRGHIFVGWDFDGNPSTFEYEEAELTLKTDTEGLDYTELNMRRVSEENKNKITAYFRVGDVAEINGFEVKSIGGTMTVQNSTFTLKASDVNNFAYWEDGYHNRVSYQATTTISSTEITNSGVTYTAVNGVEGYTFVIFDNETDAKNAANVSNPTEVNNILRNFNTDSYTEVSINAGARNVTNNPDYSIIVNNEKRESNKEVVISVYLKKGNWVVFREVIDGRSTLVTSAEIKKSSASYEFDYKGYKYKITMAELVQR